MDEEHAPSHAAHAGPGQPQANSGRRFWRSLDELAGTDAFREQLSREFPPSALEQLDGVSRRNFLKLMAASFALAGVGGLSGCLENPQEQIVPYESAPSNNLIPGRPLFFATAIALQGYVNGMLVENHMGRPTKIEGNPEHPGSLGASDAVTQASVLTLYDPDRSHVVLHEGEINSWSNFTRQMTARRSDITKHKGQGVRFLVGTTTSPTLQAQIQTLRQQWPRARWHHHESVSEANVRQGARLAFGRAVDMRYHFERAKVILALDSDFLYPTSTTVRYDRDFADKRRVRHHNKTPTHHGHKDAQGEEHKDPGGGDKPQMNRLYVAEPTPTLTGAKADHRLAMRRSHIPALTRALAAELDVATSADDPAEGRLTARQKAWASVAADDLRSQGEEALVLAGRAQPPRVHALVHAINEKLGALGRTVVALEPAALEAQENLASIGELAADMHAGKVQTLFILGGNPVYDAPADLHFARAMARVQRENIHMGLYANETAAQCQWHLPLAHELESWSDGRAFDGTASIVQPLIAPLFRGKTFHELLTILTGQPDATSHQLVHANWQARTKLTGDAFERWWKQTLLRGFVKDSQSPPLNVSLDPSAIVKAASADETTQGGASAGGGGLELVFAPDPRVWDGRYANNGWLQELPKPMTKYTWDNAVVISARTAKRLKLENEDVVEVRVGERAVTGPVWIMPGQEEHSISLALGYGRTEGGHIAPGQGFSAYPLRTSDALWAAGGATLRKVGEFYNLAFTQDHHTMENRDLYRLGTLDEFRENPREIVHPHEHPESKDLHLTLLPEHKYEGQQWGMSIDLTSCIGCGTCTIACQAENNIPIVGKDQVTRGREMHWIRVDRYFAGEADDPEYYHQPVPCMQCEKAPCELVCPVGATQHSSDGINEMIYNRCIGTRFCSNNCPYKVRRFNFYRYTPHQKTLPSMQNNPDVTVRSRGVMEKCNYCTQRIREAQIHAQKDGDRPIHDGELLTACQEACPTNAIVFGDINDRDTQVARAKAQPHDYGLLTDLGTQPRTTYLAEVLNPNPAMEVALKSA